MTDWLADIEGYFTFSLFVRFASAIVLTIGSAVLIRSALPSRRDKIDARALLIEPSTTASLISPERLSHAMDEAQRDSVLTEEQREIARRLRKFGISSRRAPAALLATKGACALGLAIVCWLFVPKSIAQVAYPLFLMLLAVGAGAIGWRLPGVAVHWSATHRAAAIVAGLPDALELLVICAEGGLALDEGIDRIVVELRRSQPALADELTLTAADLKILPSQEQALSRLAARIDVPIVLSVVATLGQTMRYGTPFAKAIRVMAAEIRSDSLARLEERANSLPTLMTLPMILFILPAILLIVCGPAGLHLWDVLHSR